MQSGMFSIGPIRFENDKLYEFKMKWLARLGSYDPKSAGKES